MNITPEFLGEPHRAPRRRRHFEASRGKKRTFLLWADSPKLQAICPIRGGVAPGDPVSLRERRLTWAERMMRVIGEDVLRCKKCEGRAAVISAIAQPKVVEAILKCLGLAVRAPPITPTRQTPFDLQELPYRSLGDRSAHRPLADREGGRLHDDSSISAASTDPPLTTTED